MRKLFLLICALLFMVSIFIISTIALAESVYHIERGIDLTNNMWGNNRTYTFLGGVNVEPGKYDLTFSLQGNVLCLGCTWGDAGDLLHIQVMLNGTEITSATAASGIIWGSSFTINLDINFQIDSATKLYIRSWETVSHPPTEYWMLDKATLSGTFQPIPAQPPPDPEPPVPDPPTPDPPSPGPPSSQFDPFPDIKANGSNGPITVNSSELVNISFSLDPGIETGRNVDWFIGAISPHGSFPILQQTLPISALSEATILEMPLHLGFWTFYAILDDNPNGILDRLTWYDYVTVISSPD